MKDSIVAGNGTSRKMKSSIPSSTTWSEFLQMLRDGTFTFDLSEIDPSGFVQLGTPLNKTTLLKNRTADTLGLDQSDPTVDDALYKIATGKIGFVRGNGEPIGDADPGTLYVDLQTGNPYINIGDAWVLITTGLSYKKYHRERRFISSGYFQVPKYIDGQVSVRCIGGGGGGSGDYPNSYGRGGNRGQSVSVSVSLTPDNLIYVTVGSGGYGGDGAHSDGDGYDGGESRFGTYLSAQGGAGGQGEGTSYSDTIPEEGYTIDNQTYGGGGSGGIDDYGGAGEDGIVIVEYDEFEISIRGEGDQPIQTFIDKITNSAFIVDKKDGSVAEIDDGANDIPVKNLIIDINPIQSGSGTPSPSNIRPITGRTSCVVTHSGRNLLPPIEEGTYTNGGITIVSDGRGRLTFRGTSQSGDGTYIYMPLSQEVTFPNLDIYRYYSVSFYMNNAALGFMHNNVEVAYAVCNNQVVKVDNLSGATINHAFMYCMPNTTLDGLTASPMLMLTASAVPFEEYISFDITNTPFGPAGTVYGGKLNAVTGELIVTHERIASYNGEELPAEWISDRDEYVPGTTPTIGAQVVYRVSNPATYQLTPQDVATILGVNIFAADSGDVSVEYRADPKKYIDKKINEVMAAIAAL